MMHADPNPNRHPNLTLTQNLTLLQPLRARPNKFNPYPNLKAHSNNLTNI